jgi:translation initiation factor IF-3
VFFLDFNFLSFTGKNVKQHETATKHLVIRNKIEQHDFDIKVKTVLKWLAKGYDVQIVLQNVTKGEGKNVV